MRVIALTLAGFLVLSGGAMAKERRNAPSYERLQSAKVLLELSVGQQIFDQMLNLMEKQFTDLLVIRKPEKAKELRQIVSMIIKEVSKRRHEFVGLIAPEYARAFTVQEMKEAIAFFRTPTGRKFLAKTPELMRRGAKIGEAWGAKVSKEIMMRVLQEMKRRGIKL